MRTAYKLHLLFYVLVAVCFSGGCSREMDVAATRDDGSYVALKAENDALRRENQMLRRELISKNGVLPDSVMPEKGGAPGEKVEVIGEETGYWLSLKTKVRHNRRCRNYRQVKGRPCGPNEGRPCKTCGG